MTPLPSLRHASSLPTVFASLVLAAVALPTEEGLAAGACTPAWQPGFGGLPGTESAIHAQAVFDDGSGPRLFVGGRFDYAGGFFCRGIACFDGDEWAPVGSGLGPLPFGDEEVNAMVVYDHGSGPALYVAGRFDSVDGVAASGIARWDGTSWSAVGSGIAGRVSALVVHDDGGGPALFAGGAFSAAGGLPAQNVARWAGLGWSGVGAGLGAEVFALAVHDDGAGGGATVWAGGSFTDLGGLPGAYVAKWTGTGWTSPAPVVTTQSQVEPPTIRALASFDDGGGRALYVGGNFDTIGGIAATGVARFQNGVFGPAGGGLDSVHVLTVAPLLGVPTLLAGQRDSFSSPSALRWTGSAWSALGSHGGDTYSIVPFAPAGGVPELLVAGLLTHVDGKKAYCIGRYDGAQWSLPGGGLDGPVRALARFDSGNGPELVAAGDFVTADGTFVRGVARHDGVAWRALGSGLSSGPTKTANGRALAVFDDGGGPALYVGGSFTSAGGVPAASIARWDGATWSSLGSGVTGVVEALAVFDDGSGAALYVAGDFHLAGGASAASIARWDGAQWSPLGAGLDDDAWTLVSYDDGSGPSLFAGGRFKQAGGAPASRVARWDGANWSPVGAGLGGTSAFSYVRSLAVHPFSGGTPALVAGGAFPGAGGVSSNVARWDGATWSAAGSGFNAPVLSLDSYDLGDGGGPTLLAAGVFFSALGGPHLVARWGGVDWQGLPGPIAGTVNVVAGLDAVAGAERAFHLGGLLLTSPEHDSFIARHGCASTPPLETVPGCQPVHVALSAQSPSLASGQPFLCAATCALVQSGTAILFAGVDGTDAAGCGVPIGIGELLLGLSPPPLPVATAAYVAGTAPFSLAVPPVPLLVGVTVQFQAVLSVPSETRTSDALRAVIQP